jgi:pyruvate dehydrogenase E1 component alpha subunit
LPVIFVVENNQYAVSTPVEEVSREPELYRRAAGYGVEARRIDGNHVLEVYETASAYVRRCREGKGPFVIEAMTYRHAGHHVNDPGAYMPEDRKEHYRQIDPCRRCRQFLMEMGRASTEEVGAIEAEVEQSMEEAVVFAGESPGTDVQEFLEETRMYS